MTLVVKEDDTHHYLLVDHRTEWGRDYNFKTIATLHHLIRVTSVEARERPRWNTFEPLKEPLRALLRRTFNITQLSFNSHGESLEDSYTTIDVGDALQSSVRLIKAMQLSNFGATQTDAPVSTLLGLLKGNAPA